VSFTWEAPIPEHIYEHLLTMAKLHAEGRYDRLTHEVEAILSRPATSARDFVVRLLLESGLPIAGGIIGAGGEITWPSPTRPGDILQVESEVLELRPSRSHPGRGMATIRSETRNQRGDTVQVLVARLVVPRSAHFTSPGTAPSP
jgi:hypothetical protein